MDKIKTSDTFKAIFYHYLSLFNLILSSKMIKNKLGYMFPMCHIHFYPEYQML
jgi:hypothetical protein